MKIKVNGNPTELNSAIQLLSLLQQISIAEKSGIAIAVNAEVVRKKEWEQFELKDGDEVIIIEAAQGG